MYFGRSRQAYWKKVIEKELEKLESGDMRALLTVYCAFAAGDKKLMRRAGHAIRKQLEGLLWSSIFVTLVAENFIGLLLECYRCCQFLSMVLRTATRLCH